MMKFRFNTGAWLPRNSETPARAASLDSLFLASLRISSFPLSTPAVISVHPATRILARRSRLKQSMRVWQCQVRL
jgi:hypothetical protein